MIKVGGVVLDEIQDPLRLHKTKIIKNGVD